MEIITGCPIKVFSTNIIIIFAESLTRAHLKKYNVCEFLSIFTENMYELLILITLIQMKCPSLFL